MSNYQLPRLQTTTIKSNIQCLFIALEVKKLKKKLCTCETEKEKYKIDHVYSMILCTPMCQCVRKGQSCVQELKLSEGAQRKEVKVLI